MTDLDDALNSSAPMLHPVEIVADWLELPPGYSAAGLPVDALSDLGQQIGPTGYTVEQSLDDALPDPVTMTAMHESSGKVLADLVGRQANVADAWGWRANSQSGTGSDVTIEADPPNDAEYGDYTIVAIACSTASLLADDSADAWEPYAWDLLGTFADGALTVWVWGRSHYVGAPAFVGRFPTTTAYSWVSGALWARTAAGSVVPIVPGTAVGVAESASVTSHTSPAASIERRGYVAGIFASLSASAAWTATGGATEVGEVALTADVMLSRSTFQSQPNTTLAMTATTTVATATAVMIAIPLGIGDRDQMSATQYFSPFNRDSPVLDFERDTAPVTVSQPVVTASGVVSTQIFKGQMAGLDIKSRAAELTAFSRTRIDLDKSLVLPTVYGLREGGSVDWLACYLMAWGGQYPGVAPSPQTRVWVPFYGSAHPFLDGAFTYPRGNEFIGGVESAWRPPKSTSGPFVSAMYGQQLTPLTQHVYIQFDDRPALSGLPGMDGEYNDFFTRKNNKGRMTVWVRGDVRVAAPTSLGANVTNLFEYNVSNRSRYEDPSFNRGGIEIKILGTGQIHLRMGSDGDGYASLPLTPETLPQDGEWHFFGVAWDWDIGEIDVRLDNTVWNTSGWTTTLSYLPADEEELFLSGGHLQNFMYSRIPISEFQVETGPTMYSEGFARFWPTRAAPSHNATFRPTNQWLEVIADTTPVQGWDTLSALGRATLSAYRTNEEDNFEFLPLDYFGETAQLTPATVTLDTGVNAGELAVVADPSRTRNVVTLEYEEVRVDTLLSRILQISSSIEIPRGVTTIVFPLDVPAVEFQGALSPYSADPVQYIFLQKLSSAQIAAPATIPTDRNFMTVNTKADGTGSNWDKTTINAKIVAFTTATVTIRFVNNGAATVYLANNGQDVPFLNVLGYAIRSSPAYTTTRDNVSIAKRRERTLTSEMPWIQRREEAEAVAAQMVNILARPREEITVRVMGDPRRRPGQLVTLADSEQTRAEGTWRVLLVNHVGNGPMFLQDLKLVRVLPIGVWDGLPGWDNVSWGE
ncbi:MAG: hypothetical protein ABW022_12585 [Actinoplanes sp.]